MPLDKHQRQVVQHLRAQTTIRIAAGELDLTFDEADGLLCHDIAIALQGYWSRKAQENKQVESWNTP